MQLSCAADPCDPDPLDQPSESASAPVAASIAESTYSAAAPESLDPDPLDQPSESASTPVAAEFAIASRPHSAIASDPRDPDPLDQPSESASASRPSCSASVPVLTSRSMMLR